MYVRDLVDSLVRRWYLVIVALALTGGACFAAMNLIPPTYRTEASVVLIPPRSVEDPSANRFLGLSNLNQAVDVLARSLNADESHDAVRDRAPRGTFEVAVDSATSAPVLVITAKAPSAVAADAVIDSVLAQVPLSLRDLQASLSIPRGAEITSIPLSRDDKPALSQKSRIRVVAALTILCLGGGALAIAALDGLLLRRSARRELNRPGPRSGSEYPDGGESPDGDWLESELATITSGGLDSTPPKARRRPGRGEA